MIGVMRGHEWLRNLETEQEKRGLYHQQTPEQTLDFGVIQQHAQAKNSDDETDRTPDTDATVGLVGWFDMRHGDRFRQRQGRTGEDAERCHDKEQPDETGAEEHAGKAEQAQQGSQFDPDDTAIGSVRQPAPEAR